MLSFLHAALSAEANPIARQYALEAPTLTVDNSLRYRVGTRRLFQEKEGWN
jgi:hypothetical protein